MKNNNDMMNLNHAIARLEYEKKYSHPNTERAIDIVLNELSYYKKALRIACESTYKDMAFDDRAILTIDDIENFCLKEARKSKL